MTGALAYLLIVVAGALLANGVPHLVSGVRGDRFPTPFAAPPGRGESSPVINVLWGVANGLVGAALAIRWLPHRVAPLEDALCAAGFLAMALFAAHHFGKVRN